jgi:hypothetical protein
MTAISEMMDMWRPVINGFLIINMTVTTFDYNITTVAL